MKTGWMLKMLEECREAICKKCKNQADCEATETHCGEIDGILAVEHHIRKELE